MSTQYTVRGLFCEDSTNVIQGRICSVDGSGATVAGEGKALIQSDLTSVTCKVFSPLCPATQTYSATLVVSAVIFNTLQTGGAWNVDTIGFNVQISLPPAAFPAGNQLARAEVLFTLTGGTVLFGRWEGPIVDLLTG